MSKKKCPECGAANSSLATHCSACNAHLHGANTSAMASNHSPGPAEGLRPTEPQKGNLSECPDCGSQVSRKAASCPHCGAPRETAQGIGSTPVRQSQSTQPAVVESKGGPTFGQRVIAAILAVVLFTHGYFLLRYKALTPCEAAARKVVVDIVSDEDEGPVTKAEAMGAAFATKYIGLSAARLAMSTESTAGCYGIALGLKDYRD